MTLVARNKIAADFDFGCAWPLLKNLRRLGVTQYARTKVLEVKDGAVVVSVHDKKTDTDAIHHIPCDTIVTAVGSAPNDSLYQALQGGSVPVYQIGDAECVGKLTGAIRAADDLAMRI